MFPIVLLADDNYIKYACALIASIVSNIDKSKSFADILQAEPLCAKSNFNEFCIAYESSLHDDNLQGKLLKSCLAESKKNNQNLQDLVYKAREEAAKEQNYELAKYLDKEASKFIDLDTFNYYAFAGAIKAFEPGKIPPPPPIKVI